MMNKVLGKEMHEGIAPDKGECKMLNSYQYIAHIFLPRKTRQTCPTDEAGTT